MTRRPTRVQLRRRFEAIADEWEPVARAAFLSAVNDIASNVELGRIAEALERGDIDAAIRAVHLDPAAFRGLEAAITEAYGAGGAAAVGGMPVLRDPSGGRVIVRFDVRAPRAEAYLREHGAALVTRIVEDQRQALRVALTEGMVQGRNPRAVARDLRGVIGLTERQAAAVEKSRSALLSGDTDGMRNYLQLERRDRRFDRTVAAAIREGRAVPREAVERITRRYGARLLDLRAETIARTEMLEALARSKEEAFRQAIDTGAVQATQVKKRWIATTDARTRDSHAAVNGEVVALDQPFSNGLRYPHEEGAPVEEVVNCRCTYEHTIDFLAGFEQ
jgi:SPP1 gp7 family putative phage head morphogenesis protein